MSPFVKLGKVINLNRKANMRLINRVFQSVGDKDRKQIQQYPHTFCNIGEPFDKENYAARYIFTQCPNAEFAKKHGLLHMLPLFCNSDRCDYCVVGSENPMAKKYEIVKDEMGFLISKERGRSASAGSSG